VENLRTECIKRFELAELNWDESITPDLLIPSMNRLAELQTEKEGMFKGIALHLSKSKTVYVTNNGKLSIPVDWS
jgi:hypothetical protein